MKSAIPTATALALAALVAFGSGGAQAQQQEQNRTPSQRIEKEAVQLGISTDSIEISTDFSGASIAVFGVVENPNRLARIRDEYAIVAEIRGPRQSVAVRRKERTFGIWINRQQRIYSDIPSFYALASNHPLEEVADEETLKELEIGIDNIRLSLFSRGAETFILPAPEFARSLRRINRENGLFSEDEEGVVFLGADLFRARLNLPSDVPVGQHQVYVHLFRNGERLASREDSFQIRKQGFGATLNSFAHEHSIQYGLGAVLMALAVGWLANLVFRTARS